jgi:hypothetical protein
MSKRSFTSILAALTVLILMTVACRFSVPGGTNTIAPSGVIITETREVSGFDSVDFNSIGEVTLVQGETESLVIEADDNLMPYVDVKVSGSKLTIGMKDETGLNFSFGGTEPTLHFTLTVKDLSSLEVSGLATVNCDSLSATDFVLGISGGGDININSLAADTLEVNLSGLGDITLAGQATDLQVNISGAGNYNGGDLESATVSVNVSGLGDTTVWVTGSLDVTISGAGNVDYYGSPSVMQNVSGLGDLNSLGEH